MNEIWVTFDNVFSNEYFRYLGFEYQRANCGPYDKKRKAYNEDADEWFTFNGRDRVLVWRY